MTNRTDEKPTTGLLTPADLSLLNRPLFGFLTTAAGPTPPQPRPLWYEVTADGKIQFFTFSPSAKLRRLEQDPRASLVVSAPVGEPEHWVSVAGPTTIETDGVPDLAQRLAERYWDMTDSAEAALKSMLTQPHVRVVIHPDQVKRFSA
ncbi:pyridoxamine 5'-phosphate oxidase family protein [Kineosporia babensis]|uniref:Pyridoxamine 5'-phosphate oxidase family protein n=1 Tax=Kineosporia babensis TaxID=499548 RepID=A0A9X1NGL8_9ACTN|nr:pyridoxamine 5'-phosphate oxidase family protein [Kineosporia babensis]MCD5312738.1 pyridoxamine 5'-phosphate oxidase family protein [Kineosporia babensis]